MKKETKHDAILLGFGHGFLDVAEMLVSKAKDMRKDLLDYHNIQLPPIHIVDHDYDEEKNNVRLERREFVIRIYGEEKVRKKSERDISIIVKELRKVILANLDSLKCI